MFNVKLQPLFKILLNMPYLKINYKDYYFYLFPDVEHEPQILDSSDFSQLFVLMQLDIPALYFHWVSLTNHHPLCSSDSLFPQQWKKLPFLLPLQTGSVAGCYFQMQWHHYLCQSILKRNMFYNFLNQRQSLVANQLSSQQNASHQLILSFSLTSDGQNCNKKFVFCIKQPNQ